MNGGDLIGDVLARHGVRFLFTLCGGHISPILVGAKARGLRVVDTRHEATAVFAADAGNGPGRLFTATRQMLVAGLAEEIIRHLSPALDAMSVALSLTHDFDPTVSTMTFRIGLSDDVEFGLLPQVLRALRTEAPKVVIVVQHVDYWRIPDLLASGDITVGISQTRGLPANAKRKLLRRMDKLDLAIRKADGDAVQAGLKPPMLLA